jgi:Histidine kinase-, DNA gyrase B-, and HSP90-like ATPase
MTDAHEVSKPPELPARIRIGSFFLETLTTGMYEDAFHCIREYVQNAFDAVHDAVQAGVIGGGDGRITLTIGGSAKQATLSVRDNGTGVRGSEAVDRFVSLGASIKQPAHHAGFRGIGRLAGIAYCSTLKFTTKAMGEEAATIFEFDCGKLRGFMAPGAQPRDVSEVVRSSVTVRTEAHRTADHFTEVEMVGLSGSGLTFVEQDKLLPYLSQYSPVDYSEGFEFADRVRALASSFGAPIPVVEIEIRNRRERVPVHKSYKNSYPTSALNTKSTLRDLETYTSKEHGWFGWFGLANFPGEITDETVAGLRFRMKNIQIGNEGIIEELAARATPSGSDRRLQRWAVGEIFIVNAEVVPNARRDGFEDNQAWRNIQADIEEVAKRIVKCVRGASKTRGKLKTVEAKIASTRAQLAVPQVTKRVAGEVDQELRRQLSVLEKSTAVGADPKEVSQLIGQIKEIREQLQSRELKDETPATPPTSTPTQPQPSTLEVVEQVLTEQLGAVRAGELMALIRARLPEAS